ncbi:hypothetical protein [Planomonospora venezuelensis]|uniref:Uncharacterized protein n=1 Tax=Planomonospora venezuelensis TaxID=1999 RepID=A0A841CYA9_PLAVE|nr:hypothetical protein [Planomonospora venezuelensis]MBB5963372.1 hypothetical protein [Planomonospora venezuelensis]GIN05235.1 hypothetical protein Pve01_68930 [Planomonospora venezuelensis]
MMRRLATALAAATLSVSALAIAAPAQAASAAVDHPQYDQSTRITGFQASPGRVHRHHKISLSGRLQIEEECTPSERGRGEDVVTVHVPCDERTRRTWSGNAGGQKIVVLFRVAGKHKWHYVDSIWTGRDGHFYTEVPARVSGTWRVVFEGARGLSGAEARDWVKVYH